MVDIRIPYKKDSQEREANLDICLKNWYNLGYSPEVYIVKGDPKDLFPRTKIVSDFLNNSTADICIYNDCDCIIPDMGQILVGLDLAELGFPLVLPYSMTWNVSIEDYKKRERKDRMGVDGMSYGGCVIFNRKKYLEYGGENPNLLHGWGNEDFERFERIKILHGHVPRVDGDMWHLKHPRIESLINADRNKEEVKKIKAMSKDELLKYIGEWR